MASAHARSRALWQRRVDAIVEALTDLVALSGRPASYTAREVASAIPADLARTCWTEAQRAELETWVQRAGRAVFSGTVVPLLVKISGNPAVRYERGPFEV